MNNIPKSKLIKANDTLNKIVKLEEKHTLAHSKKKLPLYALSEMRRVLNDLLELGKSELIVSEVMKFFKKENYTIKQKGIGWVISW